MNTTEETLYDAFINTQNLIKTNKKVKLATKDTIENKTEVYTKPIDLGMYIMRDMITQFTKDGTVKVAYENADNYKVAILNFANPCKPCGFVEVGAMAQEEDIARCTNLYPILNSEKAKPFYDINREEIPISTDTIVYSRDVEILTYEDYVTLSPNQFKKIDVITCASVQGSLSNNFAYSVMSRRAREVVKSAVYNGRDCIILGAWGCGVFGQKPEIIARCFAEALNEHPYFVKVIFAIKGNSDTYDRFYNEFNKFYRFNTHEVEDGSK